MSGTARLGNSQHYIAAASALFWRRSQNRKAMTQTTKPDVTRSDNGLDPTLRDPSVRDPCLANPRKPNLISEIACPFFVLSLKSSQILSLTGQSVLILAVGEQRKLTCKGVPAFLSYSVIRYNNLCSPFFWGACNCLHKNQTLPAFFAKNRARRVKNELCVPT